MIPFAFLVAIPLTALTVSPWLYPPGLLAVFILGDALCGKIDGGGKAARWTDDWALRLYSFAQGAANVWALTRPSFGLAVAFGLQAGIFGMLTAHQLVHSRRRGDRMLGTLLLASVFYAHFGVAHVFGHHRYAGSAADPALVPKGEGAFRFILRAAATQFRFALARERRHRTGLYLYFAVSAAILAASFIAGGSAALLFQLIASAIAIAILEIFNYVAHYGLARRVVGGALEPFGAPHSWNVAHRFSNAALLNGGFHSDHHRMPALHRRALGPVAAAPSLPYGFALSILLATIPPLWRRVMDARLARLDAAR